MSESWRPGGISFTEDDGFGIGGPSGLSRFANREIGGLQLVEPRHQRGQVIGLNARRTVGAGIRKRECFR